MAHRAGGYCEIIGGHEMSLFESDDIKSTPVSKGKVKKVHDSLDNLVYLTEDYRQLEAVFQDLFEETNHFITSFGTFSMHHLLFHLLSFTGSADVYATSWAVGSDVANILLQGKKMGKIREGYFLFDYRVKKYRPRVHDLLQQNFVTKVTSCHAKVTVIKNEDHCVTVVGSANYTKNNRIESYVVTTNKDTGEDYIKWIKERIYAESE
jgi:hypothetical protein